MGASFTVHRSFVLENRSLFAVSGEISAGMVHVGMRATLPDREDDFEATVHGVEFIDPAGGGSENGEPALTFSYSKPEKLARWQAIDWSGATLALDW